MFPSTSKPFKLEEDEEESSNQVQELEQLPQNQFQNEMEPHKPTESSWELTPPESEKGLSILDNENEGSDSSENGFFSKNKVVMF